MIIKKEMPNIGDLVIVKVNKIMHYGAYCTLQEYNMEAYLPISEIASGWIKNIHEFVKEGQRDVAKVIFVDTAKRAIDISFKKARAGEKKTKLSEYNLEKRAESIFTKALAASKTEAKRAEILKEVAAREQTYSDLINDIFEKKDPLSGITEAGFKQALYDLVFKTIKPKKCTVSYTVEMTTSDVGSGISLIREALSGMEQKGVEVLYLGAPHYRLTAEASSYPLAEEKINAAKAVLESYHNRIAFSIRNSRA